MTTKNKLLVNLKPEDWLKIYVISEVNLFETKFNYKFEEQQIDFVCKIVADKKLPDGVELFVSLSLLTHNLYLRSMGGMEQDLDIDLATSIMHGCKSGQDRLVYLYSRWCELEGYDERVAHIFKQSLNYCIPF